VLGDMALSASEVSAFVDEQLARVADPQASALIRSLLVPPRCELRPWDYGPPGTEYPCWIVAEHTPSNTWIAYCEQGFGPSFPWGLLFLSGAHLNMGMDCGWYESLEEAFRDSCAWPDGL
jgi:hypothetical protein